MEHKASRKFNIVRSCTAHLDQHPAWTIYPDYTGKRHYWVVVMPDGTRPMYKTRRWAEITAEVGMEKAGGVA